VAICLGLLGPVDLRSLAFIHQRNTVMDHGPTAASNELEDMRNDTKIILDEGRTRITN
jgi:hypothetical protein